MNSSALAPPIAKPLAALPSVATQDPLGKEGVQLFKAEGVSVVRALSARVVARGRRAHQAQNARRAQITRAQDV